MVSTEQEKAQLSNQQLAFLTKKLICDLG